MSKEDFETLPKAEAATRDFLAACPLDTWFISSQSELVPGIIVVGQVVKGDDLIGSQYGAGLCVPERGINRYQLQLDPDPI